MFKLDSMQLSFAITMVGLALSIGCGGDSELNTQYGKIAGNQGADSLNGVGILASMFEKEGFKVKRRTKISPRIHDYDSIVWFPDDHSCPSEEVIQTLNDWLSDGDGRTLIYIGRDYDAQTDYLTAVKDSAPIDQKEELLRQVAEGRLGQDDAQSKGMFPWLDEDTTSCEWFEHESNQRSKAKVVSRKLTNRMRSVDAQLEISTILRPNTKDEKWASEDWLVADGHGFVSVLTNEIMPNDSRLFVVANGSFLLNYSLVNFEHRALARDLISECDRYGGVVFLESGPRGIEVSDSDTINHNNWAWIAQPPLRYIVPHFLVWGVLFCFVYFPIFGRPKRLKQKSTSSFRSHINAMGKLLARVGHQNKAIHKIQHYQQLVSHEPKHKHIDEQPTDAGE